MSVRDFIRLIFYSDPNQILTKGKTEMTERSFLWVDWVWFGFVLLSTWRKLVPVPVYQIGETS